MTLALVSVYFQGRGDSGMGSVSHRSVDYKSTGFPTSSVAPKINLIDMRGIDFERLHSTISVYDLLNQTAAPVERDFLENRHLGFSSMQSIHKAAELTSTKITMQEMYFSLLDLDSWKTNRSGILPYWQFLPVMIHHANGCFRPPDYWVLNASTTLNFPGQCKCCAKVNVTGEKVIHVDTLVPLVHHWSGAFYHFLIEALPRLILAETQSIVSPNATFLVDREGKYVEDFLRLLGYQNQIMFVRPGTVYCSSNMIIPPHSECGVGIPEALPLLRSRILTALHADQSQKERKILVIDRSLSQRRYITNQARMVEELSEAFPSSVFESIQLETMNISEQIRQFSQSKGVIAPHGAGLSNILFLSSEAFVVEIFPKHYVVKCYMALAKILKLAYSGLILSGNFNSNSPMTMEPNEIKSIIYLLTKYI